jgi:sulfonate transport system ATP-binding protein
MAAEQVMPLHPAQELGPDRRSAGPAGAAGAAGAAAVRVRGLTRRFGRRAVLDGIDLTLAPGEFVAVLGRSGTGKSTLLRALAGLDEEVTGRITVPRARSVVFQDARLLPWARVLDNVILGLDGDGSGDSAGGSGSEGSARDRGLAALAEVGLENHTSAWPKTLSGGEAQRAALARALVREPGLLLLDEPFGALDALTRTRMHRLLGALWERHHPAVLLVTHDVDEAIQLADRVLVLADGHLTLDLPVEVPAPRRKGDAAFVALRDRLLASLGAAEDGL